MAYTVAEIKSLIDEIEKPFISGGERGGPSFRDVRTVQLADVLYGRKDYTADLAKTVLNRINMPSNLARYEQQNIISELQRQYKRHLEPIGGKKREQSFADRREIFESWCWNQLDPDGYINSAIDYSMTSEFFFAGWLDMDKWEKPAKWRNESDAAYRERVESERRHWFPFKLSIKGQRNVAFTEHNRQITSAVMRYRLPIIDILERYYGGSRDDSDNMAKLYAENLRYIPMDEPRPYNSSQPWTREVEVCVFANFDKICHYIDLGGGRELHEAGEGEYPNPFGAPPLLLAEGFFNYNEEVAYRREPIILPFINTEDSKSIMKTHWASTAFTPEWPGVELPPEFYRLDPEQQKSLLAMNGLKFDEDTGLPVPALWPGHYQPMKNPMTEQENKLYEIFDREAQITRALSDDGVTRSNDPVTRDIMQREMMLGRLSSAQRSKTNLMSRASDLINYAYMNVLNGHYEKGDKATAEDWPLTIITTGKEQVLGQDVHAGMEIEITPQMFDTEMIRSIEPVDTRTSSRMQNIQLARLLRQNNAVLDREFLEMTGRENVDDFIEQWNEERMWDSLKPKIDILIANDFAQFIAQRDGRAPEEILAIITNQPLPGANPAGPAPGPATGAFPQRNAGTEGLQRVTVEPPPTDNSPGLGGSRGPS